MNTFFGFLPVLVHKNMNWFVLKFILTYSSCLTVLFSEFSNPWKSECSDILIPNMNNSKKCKQDNWVSATGKENNAIIFAHLNNIVLLCATRNQHFYDQMFSNHKMTCMDLFMGINSWGWGGGGTCLPPSHTYPHTFKKLLTPWTFFACTQSCHGSHWTEFSQCSVFTYYNVGKYKFCAFTLIKKKCVPSSHKVLQNTTLVFLHQMMSLYSYYKSAVREKYDQVLLER